MTRMRVALLAAVLTAGCGQPSTPAGTSATPPAAATAAAATLPGTRVAYGHYRAALVVAGGDLPFGLELRREGAADVAYLVNGPERVRIDEIAIAGDTITLRMPGYSNRLELRAVDGRLEGEAVLLRPKGVLRHLRLVAERGPTYRFFPQPATGNADFAGRWALTFTDSDGTQDRRIAEFRQAGHEVVGTVLAPSGDDRYIAGEARGEALFLSRFDGGSAQLYLARLNGRGELAGEFWTGGGAHQTFTGRRDANASFGADAPVSKLKPAATRLDFDFPDADGRRVSMSDARFRDKVVIVSIGGTWCPNCHDETAFLVPFLAARRNRGLEAVGLMFEYVDDFGEAAAAVRRFGARHRVDYPLLVAGSTDQAEVAAKLPALAQLKAYPTTLLIDRRGTIRHVHTGFSGPATGAHYEAFQRDFAAQVDALLAER